jgi:hypothetical protein
VGYQEWELPTVLEGARVENEIRQGYQPFEERALRQALREQKANQGH